MVTKEVKIKNQTGLHARPAALLVDVANKFESELKIIHGNKEANVKSIISLISLAIGCDDAVIIQGDGVDEEEAVAEIATIIKGKFNE
ncbi:phosphotransferase system HPr (HPr) family protein [Halobacteroides halobius DSM 5150]|uniref:Phosphocarrier protein HPr n=1 Tax=Halobacteroides halobius (strain ATCC 35273 / DSM 5150 / MD-1) TaxID=748449 RepID=L0KDK4_HALHC|nr:HPr family phosphocarrier protein [Halobacteroides halobius]AGB42168.1 phosphotransferase system HPr (HPr) family protein [Halobacteroides halobius DSM 5150]